MRIKQFAQRRQRGQGLVEFLVSAPLLILLFLSIIFVVGLGWLQLEVSSLTQEYGVCLLEKKRDVWCRGRYQESLSILPGQFRLVKQQLGPDEIKAKLKHRLPLLGSEWSFHEPLPKF